MLGSTERDRSRRPVRSPLLHLHLFRWAGEDAFGPHNLYRCRCGVVKPGL